MSTERIDDALVMFDALRAKRQRNRVSEPADEAAPDEEGLPGKLMRGDHHGAALLFSEHHPDWRYTPAWGRWHFWDADAALWCEDRRHRIMTLMRRLVSEHGPKDMRRASEVYSVASLARSNPGVAMLPEEWDADPWLLGTPGEVIDLRTGQAVAGPKSCYITRQTRVPLAPEGTRAPVWERFLARIFQHAPELIAYVRRIAGYALSGSVREHALLFAWGGGGNGKGTLFNTLHSIWGAYAYAANNDLLLVSRGERHPTDMAALRGARLVTASELPPGARWDAQRVKGLTGGDPVTARHVRQDFFTFIPQLTLIVFANHKPSFVGVDEAIRRRLQLIPFTETISNGERDPFLAERLEAEKPAILRWVLNGCLEWQRQGLNPPEIVRAASAEYLEAEDVLGQWIDERLVRHSTAERARTPRKDLRSDWEWWAAENGAPAWSAKAFYAALGERGFGAIVVQGERMIADVRLASPTPGPVAGRLL